VELKEEVAEMQARHGLQPGLAVVLVGSRPDSSTYVRMKAKACAEVGIHSVTLNFADTMTEEDLILEGETAFSDKLGCLTITNIYELYCHIFIYIIYNIYLYIYIYILMHYCLYTTVPLQ
jgi:hypothetical protein